MRTKLNAWPEGTPDFVSHEVLRDYIQDTSRKCGADRVTIYGARVLDVRKVESLWRVTWSTLEQDPQTQLWQEERHDSVRILVDSSKVLPD
jgi:ACS family pantothenate transporter-like MFS transporter